MAISKRFSIFDEIIQDTKSLLADISRQDKYTRPEILKFLREAILAAGDVKGIATSKVLKYSFRPNSDIDFTSIDNTIYENASNIKMNYYLEPSNNSKVASVESIALGVYDKQIVLISLYWNEEGTVNAPTLDVSLDKDINVGSTYRGTFLVESQRVNAIENGKMFDTSMFVSRSFSIKWSFPIGSTYKIRDTIVKVFLVDSGLLIQNQYDIARLAAANIIDIEASRAANEGQSEVYVKLLIERSKNLKVEIQGKIGTSVTATSSVGSVSHDYDLNKFANRAFDRKYKDGDWVEIVNGTIRRVY